MELTKKELAIIITNFIEVFTEAEAANIIGGRIDSLKQVLEVVANDANIEEERRNLAASVFNKMIDALLDDGAKNEKEYKDVPSQTIDGNIGLTGGYIYAKDGVLIANLAQTQQKSYCSAAIVNVLSNLEYQGGETHRVTIDIDFYHNGTGFEVRGAAQQELLNDINELLAQSR